VRPGAWVAELAGLLDLTDSPTGMRVIVRKERRHPGAQLRLTDIDGHRVICFATDARTGQLAELELRHRRRVRCEDRIRCAKDTGPRNLPLLILSATDDHGCDLRFYDADGVADAAAGRWLTRWRSGSGSLRAGRVAVGCCGPEDAGGALFAQGC
jgi:hypothetical protein